MKFSILYVQQNIHQSKIIRDLLTQSATNEEKTQLEVSNTAEAFQCLTIYSHSPTVTMTQAHNHYHIKNHTKKIKWHVQNNCHL